jgi:hypothetical protein
MKSGIILLLLLFLIGCSNKYHQFVSNYSFKSADGRPDYSNLDYWAAHPWKHDPSDSVPKPLLENYRADSSVDIFFLYPTSYTDLTKPYGWNAPIDNAELNAKTDYTSILYQASVFNAAGRIFSPRYRQANLSSYYPVTGDDTLKAKAAFELAYGDIKNAFEYYLRHYNNGRPIIIASHSQGTTHAKKLLQEYFDGKILQNKLVVAYVVGIFVEPNLLQHITSCESPNQTGCICSWRTFKEGYKPDFVEKEKFTAIVTNPITWDKTKPVADRRENKGSVLFNFNKPNKSVADAKVEAGVLWTRKPKFFGNIFYTSTNYHIADYNFYYLSIRNNVAQRISAFWKK